MLLNVLQIQLDQDFLLDHGHYCYLQLGRNQNYIYNININCILVMTVPGVFIWENMYYRIQPVHVNVHLSLNKAF